MTSLPVLDPFLPDRVAFRGGEGAITHAELHGRAALLAESLPDRALVINYCERRDNFTLALMAALMRGQTALFPGDRNARTYAMLAGDNPDLYCLSDAPLPFGAPGDVVIDGDALLGAGRGAGTPRLVAGSHPAARVFTSGSTGKPTVNEKSWGMLVAGGKSIPAMLQL
jgi:hypothetical protein